MNASREPMTAVAEEPATNQIWPSRTAHMGEDLRGPLRRIEGFLDCANVGRALEDLGLSETGIGTLLSWATKKFKTRAKEALMQTAFSSGTKGDTAAGTSRPTFYRGTTWGFMAEPANFHPGDQAVVESLRNRNDALRRDGVTVQPVRVDHHGFHVNRELRKVSRDEWEQKWNKQDAGVDVALATRLLRRCLADDHPDAVLLFSGDIDFTPVLQEVMVTCPEWHEDKRNPL